MVMGKKPDAMEDAEFNVVAPGVLRMDIYDDTVEGNFPGRYTRTMELHEARAFAVALITTIERCEVEAARKKGSKR